MSESYPDKKRRYDNMLTIYGRKPVLEALQDTQLPVHRVHLADSNKSAPILSQIEMLVQQRGIELRYTDKRSLSRISRNSKQDQGVAADLALSGYQQLEDFIADFAPAAQDRLLAVDGVSNPQNLGMIIRSAAASGIRALVIPEQGCAALGPLVIKASAGAIFKCPLVRCKQLGDAIAALKQQHVRIASLCLQQDSDRETVDLYELARRPAAPTLFVLGNESEGISADTRAQSDLFIQIPMHNGVESLNVAMTAALVAFLPPAQ